MSHKVMTFRFATRTINLAMSPSNYQFGYEPLKLLKRADLPLMLNLRLFCPFK